jgi:hypothetical protein
VSRSLILLAALAGLCGCTAAAPSQEDVAASLREATANAIAAQDPSGISIENPQRLTMRWEWSATYAGATYACNADDRMQLPDCSQVSANPGG